MADMRQGGNFGRAGLTTPGATADRASIGPPVTAVETVGSGPAPGAARPPGAAAEVSGLGRVEVAESQTPGHFSPSV